MIFWECMAAGICGHVAGYTCVKLISWIHKEDE